MTDVETACLAAAARYVDLAEVETDPVRRLGLLQLAAASLGAARDHCIVGASATLASAPDVRS